MGIFNFLKKLKNNKYDNYEEDIENDKYDIEYKDEIEKESKDFEDESFEKKVEKVKEEDKEKIKLSKEEIDSLISNEILKVIEVYDDFNYLKTVANEAANNIGRENLMEITKFLNGKINRPTKYINKYIDEQEWSVVVENSILMIIYSFKDDAVSVLERVSQKNSKLNLKAINLLCKLASEGVSTDMIVNWILNNLVAFNDDNKIKILGFMSQIKSNSQVVSVIQYFYKSYVKKGQIEYAYRTLNHLINAAEKFTQGHLKFLKYIAMNKLTIDLEKIINLEEDDPKKIILPRIDEKLSIEAAITYFLLDKNDDDINSKLFYLSEYSLDENLRKNIKKLLKEKTNT